MQQWEKTFLQRPEVRLMTHATREASRLWYLRGWTDGVIFEQDARAVRDALADPLDESQRRLHERGNDETS